MRLLLITLTFMSFSFSTFAKSSVSCKQSILTHASKLKSDAKSIMRSIDDQMDKQLDQSGDPTLGMHTRDMYKASESVLDSIRDLQQASNQKLPEILIDLCKSNLNVEKLVSE